jgi:hypothetical protein
MVPTTKLLLHKGAAAVEQSGSHFCNSGQASCHHSSPRFRRHGLDDEIRFWRSSELGIRGSAHQEAIDMADESVSDTAVINASAEVIFAILADPAKHAAIDGTGWVRESVDNQPLTAVGQIFHVAMYHPNHPDGNYEMANQVEVFESPKAICWKPGYDAGDGSLSFGGWTWRYDLTPAGPSKTEVTLTYDWSAVPESIRAHIGFPPFAPDHLGNSLANLTVLATS